MTCVAIVLFLLELILSLGFTVITISRFPANNECSDTSNVNSDTTASVNSARLRNVGRFDLALVLLLLLLDKLVIVVVTVVVVVVVAMAAELLLLLHGVPTTAELVARAVHRPIPPLVETLSRRDDGLLLGVPVRLEAWLDEWE
jgi:hypothetical protein